MKQAKVKLCIWILSFFTTDAHETINTTPILQHDDHYTLTEIFQEKILFGAGI